ncbi:MAG: Stealth CR1 domain-containing protein [Lachnospiraceae bacterium]|nr:Stealth CR1 domain-containing protein [Lachnospiraceae bacterium]
MNCTEKIDFVVTWVDGNDPAWIAEKNQYDSDQSNNGSTQNRYRDWDLMRYWFRGVEKYAPWVNRVYFITWGHYPKWLNREHPKLKLILHEDYIPKEYLPTFNSNVIELFLNRIEELSEYFVLFNDDTFLTAPTEPDTFFQNGLPCESALLDVVTLTRPEDVFPHTILNNSGILNRHFVKREVLRRHASKFYTPRYGKEVIRNFLLAPFQAFSGFKDLHLPVSYCKTSLDRVWREEGALLESCGTHRFRSPDDYTHCLFKCWQLCEGKFVPRKCSWGKHFELGRDEDAYRAVWNQSFQTVCLNDSLENIDSFAEIQEKLKMSFEHILPDRSSYEIK